MAETTTQSGREPVDEPEPTEPVDPTLRPAQGASRPAQDPSRPGEDASRQDTSRRAQGATESGRAAKLISASAVMAAGTALSRVMGFFRLMLLAFLFGNATRQADMFTIANTVPNSMYILLAGGVLNTVLVPQIVRAIKSDPDGGEAFTNRIMTAGLLVLAVITTMLTALVPVIIWLYSAEGWKAPGLSAQYDSMVLLAYYTMPQVFFYGVHVLAGQVLNARDKFGPMMWAPIANNLVSIAVLLVFWAVFARTDTGAAFTDGQVLLLGLGSTLGIAVQAVVLVPFLRAVGYRFRPRWDFRNTGLGKTFRLAKWTLGFVLVSQAAFVVVSRLATGATVGGQGAGLFAYATAHAVWILPHSLITVSLATAMLPAASRSAAAGDRAGVAAETMRTVRLAVTVLLPAAVAFCVLGLPLAHLIFGFGAGSDDASFVGMALMAMAVGLVPFTIQYVCLRAFYALEDTRTTFFLQCVIAAANVGLALLAVLLIDRPSLVATGLAAAYSLAYLIGVQLTFRVLRRQLPDLNGEILVRHCVRLLLAVAPAAAAAWLICWAITARWTSQIALAVALTVAGLVAVGLFLVAARLLKITEVTQIVGVLRRRGSRGESEPPHPAADELDDPGDSEPPIAPRRDSIEPAETSDSSAPPARNESSAPPARNEPALPPSETAETMAQAVTDPHPDAPAAATLPAGTVLAARYRLEELIAESRPTVTWRAFDQVLSRSVLVHLLSPGDPNADHLLAAARRASVATDSRFLRVLDAVHSTDPELGSYIVCEYATGQSLELVLSQGPLSALESAWVVREVADALAGVHSLGLFHQRISPDTVIITPNGNLKIVGLLIEAALRPAGASVVHGADTPELIDVTDLGRLLYACLVARWPGGPAYGLPDAPVVGRRWATPRQVRAGVSPALDSVCDQVLGDPPRHRAGAIITAHDLVVALTRVLGPADASGNLERRLQQPVPVVGAAGPPVDVTTGAPPVSALLSDQSRVTTPVNPGSLPHDTRAQTRRDTGVDTAVPAAATTGLRPTVVTTSLTRGRSPAAQTPRPNGPSTRSGRRPPRRWIGALILLALLLVSGGVVSGLVLDRRLAGAPGREPSAGSPESSAPPSVAAGPVPITGAREFDPEGEDKSENPDEIAFAYDQDPKTRWRTVQYLRNPKLGGIKRGVGLVLDLGTAQPVREVGLTLSGRGTDVELRVPKQDPAGTATPPMDSDADWRSVAKQSQAGGTATLRSGEPVTTRYVLVYLTSLPKEGTGYRGGIFEAEVRT
jgi:putative peptidoglycan lipid II flippase